MNNLKCFRYALCLSTLLILCVWSSLQTDAQIPIIESPTSGDHAEWSVDSHILAYRNSGKNLPRTNSTNSDVFLEHPYWEAFSPNTGDWFESNIWPLYPDLSDAETAIFQTEGFTRVSPDGEILLYPSLDQRLTIANRTTQEVFETEIDYPSQNVLPIWWSEDSEGVAVHGSGNSPYFAQPIDYYIRLRDPLDLTQTDIYLVRYNEFMTVGNRLLTPVDLERIFDVHDHQVLTTMSDLTNFGIADLAHNLAQSYLVIWNPENPQANAIIDAFNGNSIRAAAFVPNNPHQLMVILSNDDVGGRLTIKEGLYLYDIQSKDLSYLASFDEYFIYYPLFSPDGNWLAIASNEVSKYVFFRTSDLLAINPLDIPTAFPTFTPVPTYTPTPPSAASNNPPIGRSPSGNALPSPLHSPQSEVSACTV